MWHGFLGWPSANLPPSDHFPATKAKAGGQPTGDIWMAAAKAGNSKPPAARSRGMAGKNRGLAASAVRTRRFARENSVSTPANGEVPLANGKGQRKISVLRRKTAKFDVRTPFSAGKRESST